MMLGKFFLSLLLLAPISAKYLTITAGSSDITTTQCKTLVGILSKESVPTYTFSRTALLPEIVLALAVSTPGSTVTPPAVTATNTLQTYTTTTITASTATGTFSTTATIFETDSTTTTETVVSTTTSTTTSTSTAVVTVPAPTDWIPVKNSTGLKDREDQAILPGSEIQQPLEDDGSRVEGGWPPKIPNPPGIPKRKDPWEKLHPLSVTCFQTVRTRYVKMIVFIKPYATTTTIPPATSTTTSIQTVSSTSTIVPDSVTVIKSFSTTSTTTTTLTSVVTDIASATELVNATTTTTTYAACFTENQLGQRLADGWTIGTVSINDLTTRQDIQAINSTYDCCVSCLLSDQNCQYSTILFHQNPPLCGRLLNPAICRGQGYDAGEIKEYPDALRPAGQSVSNGPCGKAVYTDNRPPLNRPADGPPSAGMVEL